MANLRLINQFINIFDTQHFNDLHDILQDDFYFRSPKIEIFGKNDYIEYAKDSNSVFTTDIVKLYAKKNGFYVHEYIVTIYDSSKRLNDQIHVVEELQIVDGLIASAIIDYDMADFSPIARNLLENTIKNHGTPVK